MQQRHGIHNESMQPQDAFFWMTIDREVELRARAIDDVEARKTFCRSTGKHWSVQHKKFFRFPDKEVKKGPDNKWVTVEPTVEFKEQYKAYNHALIGRALILSKLEEAAQVCALVDLDGESSTGNTLVEVAGAFDRRMVDIITTWRDFILDGLRPSWLYNKDDDDSVNAMVDRVDHALRALRAQEVDLSPKRKQKRKMEDEDDYSPRAKRQFYIVDMEVEAGGRVVQEHREPRPRRTSARLSAKEGPSRVSGEGSGPKI